MFERRLKILLSIVGVLSLVLLVRALHVQVIDRRHWQQQAVEVMTRPELLETTRGRLLDRKGRVIAQDVACIDACVDYRVIPRQPDERWVRELAIARMRAQYGREYRAMDAAQRRQLLADEIARVKTDIKIMWETLARVGRLSVDQIDEIRQAIVRKVEMRRRFVWYRKYQLAIQEQENREPSPWYSRWLLDPGFLGQEGPQLDQFDVLVAEQTQPHVILRAISSETHNYLGKNLDCFPGLVLKPSMHRHWPYGEVACHVIGHLARVSRDELEDDPRAGDDLRRYWPNDLIGRTGLEQLCESRLRGTRGRIERYIGEIEREVARTEPVAGSDLRSTIDIELQHDVHELFRRVVLERSNEWRDTLAMPGAAVVIDVPSGQVLAMVSFPGYDLNTLDETYPRLATDEVNRPLMNRATQFALVPGSTVKPMVGLGAITQGLIGVNDTIECTGYLQLGGRTYKSEARCWVASSYHDILQGRVAHHPIPWDAPHPTGFLDFRDALERSCNVYFETLADRLGIEGLAYWYDRFGLGRPTGIGIAEVAGKRPGDDPIPAYRRRAAAWFSGIGQDQVLATPIQMASVAATIARGGVWVRPWLVDANDARPIADAPARVDLRLSPDAVRVAREGMVRAVNSRAGTGQKLKRDDITVAGKTGSAQAEPLRITRRDDLGRPIMRSITVPQRDESGKVVFVEKQVPDREPLRLGTHANPNPLAAWYRGTGDKEDRRSHAWFIGFAPAEDPKIAFAVLVEYGGGGGAAAGYVARGVLDACIVHGYLPKR